MILSIFKIKKSILSIKFMFLTLLICSSFALAPGEKMAFTEVSISCGHSEYLQPIYIIHNVIELNTMLEGTNKQNYPACIPSTIDFNKYTLIGSAITCHGSEAPRVTKDLTFNEEDKKIYYEVNIYERGDHHTPVNMVSYWILIPKVDKNIDIISKINRHELGHEH